MAQRGQAGAGVPGTNLGPLADSRMPMSSQTVPQQQNFIPPSRDATPANQNQFNPNLSPMNPNMARDGLGISSANGMPGTNMMARTNVDAAMMNPSATGQVPSQADFGVPGMMPDMTMNPSMRNNAFEIPDASPASGFTKVMDQQPQAVKRKVPDMDSMGVQGDTALTRNRLISSDRPSRSSSLGPSKPSPAPPTEVVPVQKPRIENPGKLRQLASEYPEKYAISVLGAILKVPPGEISAVTDGDAPIPTQAPFKKTKRGWFGAVAASELRLSLKGLDIMKGLTEPETALPTPPQDEKNCAETEAAHGSNEWDYLSLLND